MMSSTMAVQCHHFSTSDFVYEHNYITMLYGSSGLCDVFNNVVLVLTSWQ